MAAPGAWREREEKDVNERASRARKRKGKEVENERASCLGRLLPAAQERGEHGRLEEKAVGLSLGLLCTKGKGEGKGARAVRASPLGPPSGRGTDRLVRR
jgi:hypothetical protein